MSRPLEAGGEGREAPRDCDHGAKWPSTVSVLAEGPQAVRDGSFLQLMIAYGLLGTATWRSSRDGPDLEKAAADLAEQTLEDGALTG